MALCSCGCGQQTIRPSAKWLVGHHLRNKKLSTEHRKAISDGNKGKKMSVETIEKRRLKMIGQIRSQTARKNMSLSHVGKPSSNKGRKHLPEFGRRISERQKGQKKSEETKRRMRKSHSNITEETRRILREKATISWNDPKQKDSQVKAILKAVNKKPNKAEQKVLSILEKTYPNEWKYVGDGQLIIGGKCPDYTNDNKQLIELYGDYWHKGQDPQDRIDHFKGYGYDTLIIWENELKNEKSVLTKITNFIGGNFRGYSE